MTLTTAGGLTAPGPSPERSELMDTTEKVEITSHVQVRTPEGELIVAEPGEVVEMDWRQARLIKSQNQGIEPGTGRTPAAELVTELNAKEAIARARDLPSLELVEAWLAAEEAGDDRKTVREALVSRGDELFLELPLDQAAELESASELFARAGELEIEVDSLEGPEGAAPTVADLVAAVEEAEAAQGSQTGDEADSAEGPDADEED